MVGTIVLALTTAAVLGGLDGAQDTGRKNKNASVASTLAEQDLERLRGLPVTSLANMSTSSRTVTVARVPYTVTSSATPISDASGAVGCVDNSAASDYFKVSSNVTSPGLGDAAVTQSSLVTPPPGTFGLPTGTAAVRVTDRDGAPRVGVSITITGSTTRTEVTNNIGCAIFPFLTVGDYVATAPSTLVSWSGTVPATAPVTVAASKTSLATMELDVPASLRANFRDPSNTSVSWSSITLAHAKLPGGASNFPSPVPASNDPTFRFPTRDATNLFPHKDAYGVYAGSCEANNPAFWNANYFQPGVPGYIVLNPGDSLRTVDVAMPRLNVTVRRGTGTFPRPRVVVTQADTPTADVQCTEEMHDLAGTSSGTTLTSWGPAQAPSFSMVVPFGTYEVCAQSLNGTDRQVRTTVALTSATTTPVPLDLLSATSTTGNCG